MSLTARSQAIVRRFLMSKMGRAGFLIIIVTLLVHRAGALLTPRVYNATPVSGSTINGFEFQQNVTIECRISEDDVIRETLWTISTAEDQARDKEERGSGDTGSGMMMMSSGNGNLGPMMDIDNMPPQEEEDEMLPESPINTTKNGSRFSIEGDGGSELVINVLALELNGSVVFCRDRGDGDFGALFLLSITPINVVTSPEVGPIFARVPSNVTILCDIQHGSVDRQQWIVEGEVLPDSGRGSLVVTGPHQNTLTVVNFTGAPPGGIPIQCLIPLHEDIPIAQFSLHERRDFPASVEGEEYVNTSRECDLLNTAKIRQNLNEKIKNQIGYFAVQKRLKNYR